MYQTLPSGEYPNTAAVAPHLYGSLEEQFAYGLDRLLDGLAITRDRPATPGGSCPPPGGGAEPPRKRGDTRASLSRTVMLRARDDGSSPRRGAPHLWSGRSRAEGLVEG